MQRIAAQTNNSRIIGLCNIIYILDLWQFSVGGQSADIVPQKQKQYLKKSLPYFSKHNPRNRLLTNHSGHIAQDRSGCVKIDCLPKGQKGPDTSTETDTGSDSGLGRQIMGSAGCRTDFPFALSLPFSGVVYCRPRLAINRLEAIASRGISIRRRSEGSRGFIHVPGVVGSLGSFVTSHPPIFRSILRI